MRVLYGCARTAHNKLSFLPMITIISRTLTRTYTPRHTYTLTSATTRFCRIFYRPKYAVSHLEQPSVRGVLAPRYDGNKARADKTKYRENNSPDSCRGRRWAGDSITYSFVISFTTAKKDREVEIKREGRKQRNGTGERQRSGQVKGQGNDKKEER